MSDPPLARFAALMAGPESDVSLDEAALLIAAVDHPVDVAARRAEIDRLSAGVAEPTVDALRQALFSPPGPAGGPAFTGDADTYDHPDNSHLDRVVDRRVGLPILLSILTCEVGRRSGVAMAPVAMPGHVLVRSVAEPRRFLDPFHGGRELDGAGCAELFAMLHGPRAPFSERYLDPVAPRLLFTRVLANLEASYARRRRRAGMAGALALRATIPPLDPDVQRRLSAALAAVGDWRASAAALQPLLAAAPDADDLARRARVLLARTN